MEKDFETFQAEADDGQQWEIDIDGGPTRTTTLAWIAYKAKGDDGVEVTAL